MAATDWSEVALEHLEQGGNRSSARRAVVETLSRQRCAVSAADLADELRGDGRKVGIATVYRVLEGLRDGDLVQRVEVGDGATRYEPIRAEDHHHHLICNRCGGIEPFSDAGLERAITRIARASSFDVTGHDVVLRGSCAKCAA